MMPWMVEHAMVVISKYVVEGDGRNGCERMAETSMLPRSPGFGGEHGETTRGELGKTIGGVRFFGKRFRTGNRQREPKMGRAVAAIRRVGAQMR